MSNGTSAVAGTSALSVPPVKGLLRRESGSFRHRRIRCAFPALVLVAILALVATPALAAQTHPFITSFDGSATGTSPLSKPSGIAVDQSSANVFLADGGSNNVLDVFGPEGEVPSGIASPYRIEGFAFNNEPSGVAVDNSATSASKGDLYVADVAHSLVKEFALNPISEEYEPIGELSASPGFGEPLGVAVDSHGNVFVADYGSESVVEFDPAGTEIGRVDVSASVRHPSSVALDSAGDLFVQGYSNGIVAKYAANGSGEIEPGTIPTQILAGGASGVAVDPSTGELFVAIGNHVAQYDAATTAENPAPELEFGSEELGAAGRVAVNAETHDIYVSDNGNSGVAVFGPLATLVELPLEVAVTGEGSVTSSPAGIDCPVTCSAEFFENHTVTLTATPAPHKQVAWGAGECQSNPTADECVVKVEEADEVVHAAFTVKTHTLTALATGPGSLSASSGAISNCTSSGGANCSGAYDEESTYTLTATPAPHNQVAWGAGECQSNPTADECVVKVEEADEVVHAAFTVKTHTLTISKTGSGTGTVTASAAGVNCGSTCSAILGEGTVVTLSAIPAMGSEFAGWSVSGCSAGSSCKVTLEDATTVTAQFRQVQSPSPSNPLVVGSTTLDSAGTGAVLRVSVPGPGSILATGKYLKKVRASASGAGKVNLKLELTGAGRKALGKAKGDRLKVKVRITFTPSSGSAQTATQKVTFRARETGAHKRNEGGTSR
jgi:streptogramin lyase